MSSNLIKMLGCTYAKKEIWLSVKPVKGKRIFIKIKQILIILTLQNVKFVNKKTDAINKTYSVTVKNNVQKAQIEFQESEFFKEKSKQRYKIEGKNSELKHRHGYDIAT